MTSFIIRVYGIYIDESTGLLVSDEIVKGKYITKFPGGGLEYGEGTIECLSREMMEETGTDFEVVSHFYTTDFFIESAFHPEHQLISIYYLIKPVSLLQLNIATSPFAFSVDEEGAQSFRFIEIDGMDENEFTFPVDRRVAEELKKFTRRNGGTEKNGVVN